MENTPPVPPKFFSTPRGLALLSLGVAIVLGIEGKAFLVVPMPGRAKPVLSTNTWAKLGQQTLYPFPYHWLANGDLAYLRKNPNGFFQVCYQQMDANGPIGAVRLGPELPSTIQSGMFFPSPDEQWVAVSQADDKMKIHTVLHSADGRTTRRVGVVGETFTSWLSDSRSFLSICFKPRTGLKIRHLDSPQSEMISALNATEMPQSMSEFADGPDFQIGSFFSYSQANNVLSQNGTTITVRSFYVSKPEVVRQTWTVPVPPGSQYAGAYVSPDRKHLLWLTSTMKPSARSSWFNSLFASRRSFPTFETHFFLSDLSGNNRRPILDDVIGHFGDITPSWTPDSQHLGFIFQNQLYLVPID
ncbi:MAG: hypothetical protein JWL77_5767 [Chthonomonadaceae bacterium]|nr:hypothetical protein [Chthonomonadaceae bacterium]